VAALIGCDVGSVVFTSGATEAAALAAASLPPLSGGAVEHDCVAAHLSTILPVDAGGAVQTDEAGGALALQAANSETGIVQPDPGRFVDLVDAVQILGRRPWRFEPDRMRFALVSAHKLGGPKGVGALIVAPGSRLAAHAPGGGQEMGRRAGTENLAGIAGFGAAAEAAGRDLAAGVWARTEKLRIILENTLEAGAPEVILVGRNADRLANTACFAVPGWKGETQVMQMDLAGFAVSAGSACSSGKVRESRVLRATGFDDATAGGAIRVSLGPATTEADVRAFCDAWLTHYRRREARAA